MTPKVSKLVERVLVRYLTDREVAAWYSCSRATVWRKARLGQIPKPVQFHGMTRWDVRDLEAHSAAVRGN